MAQTTLPDYHFLYFAPILGAEWFFDAARVYCERFLPTVLSNFEFVQFLPKDASIVVTVVTRRDTVAVIGVELARLVPGAFFDPVVRDTLDEMKTALDERVAFNAPFGFTTAEQPSEVIDPTPGSLLNAPAPAITPTRIPTFTPEMTATVTATPAMPGSAQPFPTLPPQETAAAPIEPTPGSVLGG